MARRTVVGRTAANRIILIALLALPPIMCSCEGAGILKAKESVLKQDLFVLREQIDNYTIDKKKPPQSLQDLVTAGYLKKIPRDPFTDSEETWIAVKEPTVDKNGQIELGIIDVHSASNTIAKDGTAYSTW